MEQKISIFKLLIFVCFFLLLNNSIHSQTIIKGKAKIIDGDTIHIEKNKIRLHGIDAPEFKQTCNKKDEIWNCGYKSYLELKKLIKQKEVRCEVNDIDKYKRYVAECYLDKVNINQYMVRRGWAISYRYYSKKFVKDEEIAKKNKLGIWQGTFIDPYLFRKKTNN